MGLAVRAGKGDHKVPWLAREGHLLKASGERASGGRACLGRMNMKNQIVFLPEGMACAEISKPPQFPRTVHRPTRRVTAQIGLFGEEVRSWAWKGNAVPRGAPWAGDERLGFHAGRE